MKEKDTEQHRQRQQQYKIEMSNEFGIFYKLLVQRAEQAVLCVYSKLYASMINNKDVNR